MPTIDGNTLLRIDGAPAGTLARFVLDNELDGEEETYLLNALQNDGEAHFPIGGGFSVVTLDNASPGDRP